MGTTLNATFDTRREAEMTVERLVQEHGLDRADIFVAAAGDENTAGEEQAGSDGDTGDPSAKARDDAPLNGAVRLTRWRRMSPANSVTNLFHHDFTVPWQMSIPRSNSRFFQVPQERRKLHVHEHHNTDHLGRRVEVAERRGRLADSEHALSRPGFSEQPERLI